MNTFTPDIQADTDGAAIRHAFETGEYPYKKKIQRTDYEKQKARVVSRMWWKFPFGTSG